MDPSECKTIQVLKHHVENRTEHEVLASACLDIIEDIRQSGVTEYSIKYLHEFVDNVYMGAGLSLLDHLTEETDCEICRALASCL